MNLNVRMNHTVVDTRLHVLLHHQNLIEQSAIWAHKFVGKEVVLDQYAKNMISKNVSLPPKVELNPMKCVKWPVKEVMMPILVEELLRYMK